MKKVLFSAFVLTFVFTATAQKNKAKIPVKTPVTLKTTTPVFKNLLDSFSYMAGYNVATNMRDQGIKNLNADMMRQGVEDLFNNKTIMIPLETGNKCLQKQLEIFSQKKAEVEKQKASEEKAKCMTYLDNNKKNLSFILI